MFSVETVKCLDKSYLDFLVYLNGMEMNGFKIYDLFRALYVRDVEIDECYSSLSKIYFVLEHITGDPQLALYKLSEITRSAKASTFFRGYGDIVLTSGDTATYVHNTLKSEFNALKARVEELLKIIEVVYEAILVAVLGLSMLSIMPMWPFPTLIGVLILELTGLAGYSISLSIMRKLYYQALLPIVLVDVVFLLSTGFLLLSNPVGPLLHLALLIIMHVLTRSIVNSLVNLEKESLRVLSEVYSRTIQGETVDVALLDSLTNSKLVEYKLLWYSILNGFNSKDTVRRIKLPVLAGKILYLLTALLNYSSLSSTYVVSISQFAEEINDLRRFVEEKSNYYLLYSVILAALIASSYYMVTQMPIIGENTYLLGIYGYLGVIITSIPACVLKNGGFASSRISILLVIFALAVYLIITHAFLV